MANPRSHGNSTTNETVNSLPHLDAEALLQAMQANNNFFDAAMQLNTHVATFLSHRLSEEFALPAKIAASQDAEQMTEVYSDFLANTSREYVAEFEKITSILTDTATRSAG